MEVDVSSAAKLGTFDVSRGVDWAALLVYVGFISCIDDLLDVLMWMWTNRTSMLKLMPTETPTSII